MADVPPSLLSPVETAVSEAHPVQLEAVDFMDESEGLGSSNRSNSSAMGPLQEGKIRAFKVVSSSKRKLAVPSSDMQKPNFGDKYPIASSTEWSTPEISTSKQNRSTENHRPTYQQQREQINEKIKVLHDLIPNSSKADEISMLDDAIDYLKILRCQHQIMCSLRNSTIMGTLSPLTVCPLRHVYCPCPKLSICIGGIPCYNPWGMAYGSIPRSMSYLPTTSYGREHTQEYDQCSEGLQNQDSNTPSQTRDHIDA